MSAGNAGTLVASGSGVPVLTPTAFTSQVIGYPDPIRRTSNSMSPISSSRGASHTVDAAFHRLLARVRPGR
ncbi:MAG: hypothetical protein JNM80_15440 [Phycisphaerae bacterium]|nr:hypothetical protein [Phycisphaerae bacterium]